MNSIPTRIECQQGTTSVVPAFLMASVISNRTSDSEFNFGATYHDTAFSGCINREIVASSQRFLRKDAHIDGFST